MSSPGMIGLCGPLFVFLLCFVSFSCTETTTTNFNAPADQIQPATSEAANYRERAVDEFGSRVNRLVVGDLPRRAQKRIKKALRIIRNELRRDDYEPSKVARGFAALFKAIEKATAQKGAHLVTVLRLKQKKTLRRLVRLLRRANREVDDDGEKVGRYLDMISEKRQRFKNDFETNFEATRKNLGETLSDLVAVIHSINLPITPDWRRKLEHGHEIVIRRLDSARQVLENEDANIGRLLSRTTLVVRQGGSKGRQISSSPSPSVFSLPSESESESTDPEESALGQLQARFEKNNRKGSDLITQVTGLKAAHHYTNDNHNNDHDDDNNNNNYNNNPNTGVGGLHFAFQLPVGDKGNLDDDVNSMDRSEEEEERRRLRRLEGKKLEWNFRAEDPTTQVSSNEVSEEEEPAPDVVGRLMQAQKGMDRITKVHERQMSRLLHELVMSGMVTHSKLIRFVNRFEFSHDRRQHRLGKRLRKVIDIRRAQRILHERRLFSLNRERQEDSFLYNRLILRSIQSLGIHELSVELGKRKWGRKYLRSQVVKNLVRQNKLSSLAKIQNLYRLKHELQVRNQLRSRQQRKALRRVARATGIPLSSLPQLPLLKPGGGLILSLRKKSGGGRRRRGGRDEDGDGVADDEDEDAPNYEELFSEKEDEEEEEEEGEEAENQFQEYDDDDDNNDDNDNDETEDRRSDSEKEEDEHLDLEEVVEFIRKARREQEELLARHRNYVKELKRELRGEREEELDELNNIQDQDELFEALIDFSRREKRRQEREVDRYELMIEELKVNLRDQLEEIEKTEEYVCGLDSFTGLCPKREEPEGPSCDRYHGYGSYLLEFLNKLYTMRKTHREERKQLIEKLSDLEKEAEKPPKERKKKWRDEEAEDPYAALERSRGRGRGSESGRGSEDGGRDMGIAIRGPSDAHTYQVVGLAPNYEEDDDTENDTDNTNTNNSDDDDDEDEEKEIVSVNELLRLLRGLVYFSIDEEKKERDFIKDVLGRHERIHDLIMSLVERYHYEWVKIFDDEDSDLSDEEKMRDGIQDLVKLFRLARAFARKSKRDEIKLIDRISDRREELELRIEEVQKAFDAWQRYYGAVSAKVDGLLGVIVDKQSEQENAEMEIMKLLDARREEEEDEEEAVLAALHKFRKGKYDERAEKRSFKLLIFKKNKKF